MIVVYLGIVPYERTRHRGMFESYARRGILVHVDPDPDSATGRGLSAIAPQLERVDALAAEGKGLVVVKLPSPLPGSRLRRVANVNRWLGVRAVIKGLRRRDDDVVFVYQRPDLLPTVRGLGARLHVYEVRDDYAGFAANEADARWVAHAHARMVRESDLIWAISDRLVDDIRPSRPDVVLTSVGVEYEDFAAPDPSIRAPALEQIPSPRIGLVGNLNDRIDWSMVEKIAERRRDWHLVFVGPLYFAGDATNAAVERLRAHPNIHLLPAVTREEMPAYLAGFDVCMIPYRMTDATRRINPLKLYQYLAAGKPVIATPIPAVLPFADVVSCCADADEFSTAIEAAVSRNHDRAALTARRERAKRFDWQNVTDAQLDVLERRLQA